MSFFGLTSFGPDNFLKSKQVNVNGKLIIMKDTHYFLTKNLKKHF